MNEWELTCGVCNSREIITPPTDKRGWHCQTCNTLWEVDASGKMVEGLLNYVKGAKVDIPGTVHQYLHSLRTK